MRTPFHFENQHSKKPDSICALNALHPRSNWMLSSFGLWENIIIVASNLLRLQKSALVDENHFARRRTNGQPSGMALARSLMILT